MSDYRSSEVVDSVRPATASAGTGAPDALARALPFAVLALVGCLLGILLLIVNWRIIAVLLVAITLAGLTFRYPFGGVLVYLFIATLRPEELGISPATMRLQLVFAVVCMAALLFRAGVRGESRRWEWLGADKALVGLYFACWASVPLSASHGGAIGACWEFAKLVFAYIMIRHAVTSPRRVRLVVWTLVASVAITALLALHGSRTGQVYIGEGGITRTEGMTSVAGDPDTLANTLIAGLPLMLLPAFTDRRWGVKLLLVTLTILDLYVTTTTGARAGIISLIVVVFLLALAAQRKLLAIGGLSLVLVLLWVGLPQPLKDRYITIGSYQQEATYQTRKDSARLGFRMFLEHPLTGVGLKLSLSPVMRATTIPGSSLTTATLRSLLNSVSSALLPGGGFSCPCSAQPAPRGPRCGGAGCLRQTGSGWRECA